METTFYLKLEALRNTSGKVISVHARAVTKTLPETVSGNTLMLKMTLDLPATAFDPSEVHVVLVDNPAPAQRIVADLQSIVADLTS